MVDGVDLQDAIGFGLLSKRQNPNYLSCLLLNYADEMENLKRKLTNRNLKTRQESRQQRFNHLRDRCIPYVSRLLAESHCCQIDADLLQRLANLGVRV